MENSTDNKPINPLFGYTLNFKSRLDLVRKAVAVYASLEALKHGEVKIRKRLIDVLAFYVLNGYSKETKDLIVETLNIDIYNITQINSELTKKGYLITDKNNLRNKSLHPDLERLRSIFISDSPISCKRAFIIKFDD